MVGVLLVYNLESGALQYEGDVVDLASPNGAPTVILLFDANAMLEEDIPALMRMRRNALLPSTNLLLIAPEVVGGGEDRAGSIRATEHEIGRIARHFGIESMPATVVVDAAGDVLWVSGKAGYGDFWKPPIGGCNDRTSGAVDLADLIT